MKLSQTFLVAAIGMGLYLLLAPAARKAGIPV